MERYEKMPVKTDASKSGDEDRKEKGGDTLDQYLPYLPAANAIDLDRYVPYLLAAVANRLARISVKQYGDAFGVGLNEWGCLALLAREADIPATRICEVGGFDKALVSRSLSSLEARGYVTSVPVAYHNRKRLLRLTDSGRALHDQIMAIALPREERLLGGLSPAEREAFIAMLQKVHSNAVEILAAVSAPQE